MEKRAVKKFKNVLVIGIGTNVSHVLESFRKIKGPNVDIMLMDSDAASLIHEQADKKFLMGKRLTKGLGAAANPRIGEETALENQDELEPFLEGYDLIVIITFLGGGMGSGAAHVISKIAKKLNKKKVVIGIATLPFAEEGRIRIESALYGLEKFSRSCDLTIVIPISKVFEMLPSKSINDAFKLSDSIILDILDTLIKVYAEPNIFHIGEKKIREFFLSGDIAMIGIGSSDDFLDPVRLAIIDSLKSPLLDMDLKCADALLLIVEGADVSRSEIRRVIPIIEEKFDQGTEIIFGHLIDYDLENTVRAISIVKGKFSYSYIR